MPFRKILGDNKIAIKEWIDNFFLYIFSIFVPICHILLNEKQTNKQTNTSWLFETHCERLIRWWNCLPLASIWVHYWFLVGSVLLTILLFCAVRFFGGFFLVFFIVFAVFAFVLCLVYPVFPVSLDCPFYQNQYLTNIEIFMNIDIA
jgi:hypothetical protein